jgi:hypothetical protein
MRRLIGSMHFLRRVSIGEFDAGHFISARMRRSSILFDKTNIDGERQYHANTFDRGFGADIGTGTAEAQLSRQPS